MGYIFHQIILTLHQLKDYTNPFNNITMNRLLLSGLFLLPIGLMTLNAKGVIDERKIEPAMIEVLYKRIKVTDTLMAENDFKTDYLTLMAGKNVSAFYSARRKTHDSLMIRNSDYVRTVFTDMDLFRNISESDFEKIFKNYPEGKTTTLNYYSLTSWIIEEDFEKPEWKITDSTTVIGNYECFLAITDYRGRRWHAWFTPEIGVQEGPWKLCGLPGLILEAHDEKKHYQFSAQTIRLNPGCHVEYFDYNERKRTDRITSLKNRHKALKVSVKDLILSSGAYGISPDIRPDKSKKPEHRNYDFEETDYPHE